MEKELAKPVFIVGHKNPDTDSICSAIVYAELKNRMHSSDSEEVFIAGRAGAINQETEFVLDRFHVEQPQFIADVKTQVSDMEIRRTEGVSKNLSLKRAWKMMRGQNVETLPITKDGKLQGLITISDIATSYMDVYDNRILSTACTPYKNILDTLDAKMLVGDENAEFNKGEVVIAAANPDMMEEFIHDGDMVILGNRYESQLCAIEMNAACIVVCLDAKVSMTIKKLAEEHGCNIITSPHDTFTVARLINQSIPIAQFMKAEKLTTFHLTEKTDDIKLIMGQKRYRYFPVLNKQDQYIGMITRRNLLNLRKRQLILVDHNEESQAVDGIESADIREIIDHHRLGSLETMSPVYFRNEPLGCTATIVYQMYRENKMDIPKDMAGLLCAAIISDTLLFRSPTCTKTDKKIAEKLSEIAEINMEEFAQEMFAAGSDLDSKPPEEIFYQDFKKFVVGNISFGISQINSMSTNELTTLKNKMIPYIEKLDRDADMDAVFFMLTDIMNEQTEMIYHGRNARQMMESAFFADMEADERDDICILRGVVSRKKQVVPALVSGLQQ